MTDGTDEGQPNPHEFDGVVGTVPPRRVDPVLQAFVNIADTGSGVAVTLLVGGTLVHGTLVSERRWLELLDEAYVRGGMEAPGFAEGAPTPDGLEELRERQERILDARDRARDEGDRDRFDDLTRRLQWSAQDHVHLTEVQVVAAGVPPLRLNQGLLRLRITQVDGFMPGSMSVDPPEELPI